jgi:hypothetical protein
MNPITPDSKILRFLRALLYSFPIQLLLVNLKKNQVILIFWVLLFGFLAFDLGQLFGIPYLLIDPEYQDEVSWIGLIFLGITFGIFCLAFHITCYILDCERFRFLAALRHPLAVFALNNSLIPLAFAVVYTVRFANFQYASGGQTVGKIALELIAFWVAALAVHIFAEKYFNLAGAGFFKRFSIQLNNLFRRFTIYRVNMIRRVRVFKKAPTKVELFISNAGKLEDTRRVFEIDKREASKIFARNHFNAVMLEFVIIMVFFVVGLFSDISWLQIPAGASMFLFFSFVIMFIGALSFWLRGWSLSVFIVVVIIVNQLFIQGILKGDYQAFGINYDHTADYNLPKLMDLVSDEKVAKDRANTIQILNNWKEKNQAGDTLSKPPMVLIATSGGGLRSAVWTMRSLQHVDSLLNGKLMNHTSLITGASGGLIGASFYRELYLQNLFFSNLDINDPHFVKQMGRDILNPLVFSLVTNDLFLRIKKFNDGKYRYHSDRGYVFEEKLIANTGNFLNKRIFHYRNPEREAIIPMLLIAPVILNDGRKLYISPHPVSYMCRTELTAGKKRISGVEFNACFEANDAPNLKFTSALRMNATFPYITPNVYLPASPPLEIMDGGLSDNYGVSDAIQFATEFKDWIEANTSGVVLLIIRDTPRERPMKNTKNFSLLQRLLNPVGSLYNNWSRSQDYHNEMLISATKKSFTRVPFNVASIQYLATKEEEKLNGYGIEDAVKTPARRASLSWHLTKGEKQSLFDNIRRPHNTATIRQLEKWLVNQQ